MKKLFLLLLMVLGISLAGQSQVYVTDAYGTERFVNYGQTYVYVEVDGEWMKTRLYSTMCPTCGHYFDCWHRHYRYSTYTIPSYAAVGLYWYFIRPALVPTIYYRHYPVHVRYSYPVYVDYYRVHHCYPPYHVHHSHPAPAPKHHHAAPSHKSEPPRSSAPRTTVNTRSSAAQVHSQNRTNTNVQKSSQGAPKAQPSHSSSSARPASTRTSSPATKSTSVSRPSSSSSVMSSSPSSRPSSSSRTTSTRTTTSTRR